LTLAATAIAVGPLSIAQAQQIEPRAYSNAPVGMNFLIAGYAYSKGAVPFDPSLPVKDAQIKTSNALLAYARVLDLWGKSAKFDAIVPYTWLSGSAELAGRPVERNVNGLADSLYRLSVNWYGAPAMTLKEFKNYQQDLIVGTSLQVSAPSSQYDPSRMVNIGTNRWSFKPEVGVSQAWGPLRWSSRPRSSSSRTTRISSTAKPVRRTRSIRCSGTLFTASTRGFGVRSTLLTTPVAARL
jgi:hypothetical protein